jgi:site-specific DNA-cytosine methylase
VRGLILSLFPGIDLLGRAFEAEGFCVVWGPDVIYARDIRGWHVPPGRFDGVIAGVPCKCFSSLAHMVRANGYAITSHDRSKPVKVGGSGKLKRDTSAIGTKRWTKRGLRHAAAVQGFPDLDLTHLGWRVDAACEAIGNGVPRVMGQAFARAIAEVCG